MPFNPDTARPKFVANLFSMTSYTFLNSSYAALMD